MRKSGISLRVRVIRDGEFNDIVRLAGSSPATSSKNPAEMLDFLCVKVFTLFYTVLWSDKSR